LPVPSPRSPHRLSDQNHRRTPLPAEESPEDGEVIDSPEEDAMEKRCAASGSKTNPTGGDNGSSKAMYYMLTESLKDNAAEETASQGSGKAVAGHAADPRQS